MNSEDKIRVLLNELKLEMGKLDEENDLLKSLLEQKTSDAIMISTLKSDFEATAVCLEIEKKENANLKENLKRIIREKDCSEREKLDRINSLEEELEKLTLEKTQSKCKLSAEIEELTIQNLNLLEENCTLQLLSTEMAQELERLTTIIEDNPDERTTEPDERTTESFPLPLSENSQNEEFENAKKKLIEAIREIHEKDSSDLKLESERVKEENRKLKEQLELQIAENDSRHKKDEEEIKQIKLDNELKTEQLDIYNKRVTELEQDLEKVTQEKLQSDAEIMDQIDSLTTENQNLLQENTTVKMLNTEMAQEIETLTMLRNELEVNMASTSKPPEPEVTLENELEDTTCTICTEEMRLRKCTPCRRRFHKSCVENWLVQNNSCPTCRAPMY